MAAENVPATGTNMVDLAADIVSAYVSNNSVPTSDLPALIGAIHSALSNVGKPQASEAPRGEPAVPVKKSITPDHLISLFDGKKYKSLKRHLRTSHNMTPQEYRAFWNLLQITRWWLRTMPRRVLNSRRPWGLVSSVGKKPAKKRTQESRLSRPGAARAAPKSPFRVGAHV